MVLSQSGRSREPFITSSVASLTWWHAAQHLAVRPRREVRSRAAGSWASIVSSLPISDARLIPYREMSGGAASSLAEGVVVDGVSALDFVKILLRSSFHHGPPTLETETPFLAVINLDAEAFCPSTTRCLRCFISATAKTHSKFRIHLNFSQILTSSILCSLSGQLSELAATHPHCA